MKFTPKFPELFHGLTDAIERICAEWDRLDQAVKDSRFRDRSYKAVTSVLGVPADDDLEAQLYIEQMPAKKPYQERFAMQVGEVKEPLWRETVTLLAEVHRRRAAGYRKIADAARPEEEALCRKFNAPAACPISAFFMGKCEREEQAAAWNGSGNGEHPRSHLQRCDVPLVTVSPAPTPAPAEAVEAGNRIAGIISAVIAG